jgi:hypothetical protein
LKNRKLKIRKIEEEGYLVSSTATPSVGRPFAARLAIMPSFVSGV